MVLLVDLRMLGFLKGISYSALHRLLPWGVSRVRHQRGDRHVVLCRCAADFYVTNPTFFWKLALILVAGANALYFTVFEQAWTVGRRRHAAYGGESGCGVGNPAVDGRDLLRSDAAVSWPLILMNEQIQLALIVTLLAVGASVLIGVLGYVVEKNSDEKNSGGDGNKPEGNGV